MTIAPETVAPVGVTADRRVWLLVAALFLCTLLIQGMSLGGIAMFDKHVLDQLGTTRAAFKFRDLVYILSASFSCLIMAWLCEKIGVRAVVIIGLAALSCALAGYSVLSSLWMVYVLQAIVGFSYACIHVVVLMIILSRWFSPTDPRRGIALGICVSGASCGAVVMSQLVVLLFGHFEWHMVFRVLAFLPFLIAPLVWFAVRTPDDAQRGDWLISRKGALGFSLELFARPIAGVLMIAIIPVFYVSACIASHTVLMLTDKGLSSAVAAGALSTLFSCGLIGKAGSGFLLLRLKLDHAWLLLCGSLLCGSLLLLLMPDRAYLAGLAFVGLGWGGCFPLAQLKIAEFYPGPTLAQVLGMFVVFESFGSAAGAWLTAILYDMWGNYSVPFAVNCGLISIGMVAALVATHMRVRGTV